VNGKKESLDSAAQDVKEKDDSKAEQVDCKVYHIYLFFSHV